MLDSFIILSREGFEAFLIVAVILAYVRKTGRPWLVPAAMWGVGASLVLSVLLGFVLRRGVNEALWEGVLGLSPSFSSRAVVHMWRAAPGLKRAGARLDTCPATERAGALLGVFFFTLFMITREGMETVLMLLQVRGSVLLGGVLGVGAAAALAVAWARYGHRINVRRFFQVTGIFLLLFLVQITVYSFHELSEAGLLPNSEAFHQATEPLSPVGVYGRWFSFSMVAICAFWLGTVSLLDWMKRRSPGEGIAGTGAQ
jgi:high-affinity iron transporter